MTTIRDVAKHAGVSVATISRVLNSNGYVNEETKKRVLRSIDELKYKPNAVARSLFKKQSKTIGLIVPDITNPFFPELARAVEDVTNSEGYTVMLCNSDENSEKELEYLDIFSQKYVDGAIIVSNTLQAKQIEQLNMPIVVIDRPIHANIPSVVVKNQEGARVATEHLKDIGCKVIAHIRGPENVINAGLRYRGYLDIVKGATWFHESLVVNGNYAKKTATAVTKQLLLDFPEVDGIFAGNDLMALGAIKAAEQMGRKVPEDLAIIGFDGIDLCEITSPELTTMAQPIYEMGTTAAKKVLSLLEGKRLDQNEHVFEVSLIKRQSTTRTK